MDTFLFGVTYAEWVGYLATAVVLASFLNKNMIRLRVINSIGCLLWVTYGMVMPETSWPIVITNSAIFAIHCYYLIFVKTSKPA